MSPVSIVENAELWAQFLEYIHNEPVTIIDDAGNCLVCNTEFADIVMSLAERSAGVEAVRYGISWLVTQHPEHFGDRYEFALSQIKKCGVDPSVYTVAIQNAPAAKLQGEPKELWKPPVSVDGRGTRIRHPTISEVGIYRREDGKIIWKLRLNSNLTDLTGQWKAFLKSIAHKHQDFFANANVIIEFEGSSEILVSLDSLAKSARSYVGVNREIVDNTERVRVKAMAKKLPTARFATGVSAGDKNGSVSEIGIVHALDGSVIWQLEVSCEMGLQELHRAILSLLDIKKVEAFDGAKNVIIHLSGDGKIPVPQEMFLEFIENAGENKITFTTSLIDVLPPVPPSSSEISANTIIDAIRMSQLFGADEPGDDEKPLRTRQAENRIQLERRVEGIWSQYYDELKRPAIRRAVWGIAARNFSRNIAKHFDSSAMSDDVLLKMADILYKDMLSLESKGVSSEYAVRLLHKVSTDKIAELSKYPNWVVDRATTYRDYVGTAESIFKAYKTILAEAEERGYRGDATRFIAFFAARRVILDKARAAAEIYYANYDAIVQKLTAEGVPEDIAKVIAGRTCAVKERDRALSKADSIAQKWRTGQLRITEKSLRQLHGGDPFGIAIAQGIEFTNEWLDNTQGEVLSATEENLVKFGLDEPLTIKGRAIKYLPSEGIPGLVSIIASPYITQNIFNVDPRRNPAGFFFTSLGTMHVLNSVGGAISDIIPFLGKSESAVQIGGEILTSPSLARTYLRSAGNRLTMVAGFAEGAAWMYPGYLIGETGSSIFTDDPTINTTSGLLGGLGLPIGLRILLGKEGMLALMSTSVGKMVPIIGTAMLAKSSAVELVESRARFNLSDEDITFREEAINELGWKLKAVEWLAMLWCQGYTDAIYRLRDNKGCVESEREELIQQEMKKLSEPGGSW